MTNDVYGTVKGFLGSQYTVLNKQESRIEITYGHKGIHQIVVDVLQRSEGLTKGQGRIRFWRFNWLT